MYETKILKAEDPHALSLVSEALQAGKVVAVPTETVYGLAADIRNEEALAEIFKVKSRPADNPLIVHVGSVEAVEKCIRKDALTENVRALFSHFSPGPLSIVLPKADYISDLVSASLSTVAIRIPAHNIFLSLLKDNDLALAAPSANLSGLPSPTTAIQCYDDLNTKIPYILDGGPCSIGIESSVIRLDEFNKVLQILRPGDISAESLIDFLNSLSSADNKPWTVDKLYQKNFSDCESVASPGMKYRHYSPQTPVFTYKVLKNKVNIINDLTKIYSFVIEKNFLEKIYSLLNLNKKTLKFSVICFSFQKELIIKSLNLLYKTAKIAFSFDLYEINCDSYFSQHLKLLDGRFMNTDLLDRSLLSAATFELFSSFRFLDKFSYDFIMAVDLGELKFSDAYQNRLLKAVYKK